MDGWRVSRNQRRRIREAEERPVRDTRQFRWWQADQPDPNAAVDVPRRPPHPVSGVLSNWMLERARNRNARADQRIAEIDRHLANPIVVNRLVSRNRRRELAHLMRTDTGEYVPVQGFERWHSGWAVLFRNDIIEDGLRTERIEHLRRLASRPVTTEPNPLGWAGIGITESDDEWLDE